MDQRFINNKLVSGFQNINQQQNFQNNALLQNNPLFVNPNLNPTQIQQMQMMQTAQMQKLKEMQQLKQIEKIKELEGNIDKEKLKESIIRPIKIEKGQKNKESLEREWKLAQENYKPTIEKYWKERNNQPYKNILKNENYKKEFKQKEDLIIHKVSNKDKEGVDQAYIDMGKKLETHNDELKLIYSTNKENEYKKKFDYNNVYKYRVQYNPKDHGNLKEDKIKYYKELQKKEEAGKKKIDNILETLINDGIFEKDEVDKVINNSKESYDNKSLNSSGGNNSSSDTSDKKNKIQSKKDMYLNRQKNKNIEL